MIYLDSAATSFHKPKQVVDAINDAMLHYSANPGRSGHDLSVKAAEKVFEARECLNGFFGGYGSEYVTFTANCTQALNIAIKGVLEQGDHVVISCFEHNSVLRPLYKLQESGKIEFSVFNVSQNDDETINNFREAFKENTRLCIVTAVSNVFGNVLPLKRLSELAHEKNAYFFVDGAQGAGVVNINMGEQGIDCLCVPGHKGLLGPMGTGALLHKGIRFNTLLEGGTGTNSLNLYQPQVYPERLESGTLNVPGICGLCAGVRFVESQGLSLIHRKEAELVEVLFNGLKQIKKVTLYSEKFDSVHFAPVLSFNVEGMHSERVTYLLSRDGVAVRGGFHCSPLAHRFMGTEGVGTVRASPSFFNTKKDINILLNLVEKIAI